MEREQNPWESQHKRTTEEVKAKTTKKHWGSQQVPTVDHGVAKVRNIRSYKTALADSIQLPEGWQPDKAKLNVDVDPFKTIRFHTLENSEFYPNLRITYVLP